MKNLEELKKSLPENYEDILNTIEGKFNITETDELTDEQVDEICAFLADNAPESTNHTLKIPSNVLERPDPEYIKTLQDLEETSSVTVRINPMTGLPDVNMTEDDIAYTDTKSLLDVDSAEAVDIPEKENIEELTKSLDISEEEAMGILERIIKMDKSTYYEDAYDMMPDSVKHVIDNNSIIIPDKSKNELANGFLQFLRQNLIKKQQYTDLQNIASEQEPGVKDDYYGTIRTVMETNMLRDAEAETDKFKSKRLRECSNAFTNSYTFDFVKEYITKKRVPVKVKGKKLTLAKELERDLGFYKTFCNGFSAKYRTSKFTIDDITTILPILNRKLPIDEFDSDDIAMFVIVLCKIFSTKKVNNIVDHTLMYFTLKNIVKLDTMKDEQTDFETTIIDNVADTIRFIKKYDK